MSRMKINLPEIFPFSTEMRVNIADINYGQHMGNDAALRFAHEARLRFLAQYDYSETDIEGCGLIMTNAAIVYKSQAFYGDTLQIGVSITDLSRTGFEMTYRLQRTSDHVDICHMTTGLAFFDYEKGRVSKVPANFLNKTGAIE